jgi:hypothetical protein
VDVVGRSERRRPVRAAAVFAALATTTLVAACSGGGHDSTVTSTSVGTGPTTTVASSPTTAGSVTAPATTGGPDDATEPTTQGQAGLFVNEAIDRRVTAGLPALVTDGPLTNAAKELARRYIAGADTNAVFGGLDDVLSPRDGRVLSMWIWCNDPTPTNRCGGTLGELTDYLGRGSKAATALGRAEAVQGTRWIAVVLAGADTPDDIGLRSFADTFADTISAARTSDESLDAPERLGELDALAGDLTDAWTAGRDLPDTDPALAERLGCDDLTWAYWGHGALNQPTTSEVLGRALNETTGPWGRLQAPGRLQYGVASGPFHHTLYSAVLFCTKPTLR